MNKDIASKNTRDLGFSLVNPKIKKDINEWLYDILLSQDANQANRFRKYRDDFERVVQMDQEPEFPLHLIVEALYACNYRCPQCLLGIPEYRQKYGSQGSMSMDQYKKIIDEAEKYQTPSILLNGVNEPLLDAHLFERMKYARAHGFVDIHIHSNGELLTEKYCHELIESGCTRFMISLDAFSAGTFSKIRVGGNYDKVLSNIDLFLKIRGKSNSKLPVFRVSMVRQRSNEHEIQSFIDHWVPIADYVYLQTYMELVDVRNYNYFSEADMNILGHFNCDQPWYSMFIRPKGDAHPCCSFLNYELKMGNTQEQSLYHIWHSESYKSLRALHKRGEYFKNDACTRCVKGLFPK